jgi:hypothetical protein
MVAIIRIVAILSLSAGLNSAAGATSPAAIGVDYFTSDGQRSGLGTGLSGMADTILLQMLEDPANKDCKAILVEVKRTAERQRELELARSPLVDPSSRLVDRTIQPTHRLTGSVVDGVNGASFALDLTDARSGEVVGSVSASGTGMDGIERALRESLAQLLEKLCPRIYHLKANTGPHFHIEAKVCGFDRPFRVNAKGQFSGVSLEFKPTSNASGSFTQGGRAYGTNWRGGGPYTVSWSGDAGQFSATDSYTAENVAGRTREDARMTGTVVRTKQGCKR